MDAAANFIERWQGSGGAERANYAMFLNELTELLGVGRPEPQRAIGDPAPSGCALEYPVTFRDADGTASTGRIDLYKRGCFVLEAKQGTDADLLQQLPLFALSEQAVAKRKGHGVRGTQSYTLAMQRARAQAERYAKALPVSHGWPPFLIVVDVGHSIELFADFSLSGKSYTQYPDAQHFRIALTDLADEAARRLLAHVWTEPLALDPAKKSAEVTREVARHLAELSRRLEQARHDPASVARFTPRAFVERLILPTLVEPLRDDWKNVQSAAMAHQLADDPSAALNEVRAFHEKLCATRVLDPACGTGNFLYVAMEHMKRLEGEVIELARDLGEDQYFLELEKHTVDPHQFLGIELNPRAAVIAELVLWIGWLQWHFRTRGKTMPAQPVLKNFRNIEARDALLDYHPDGLLRDAAGKPVTRWDGRSFKKHPVTGKEVPDDAARVTVAKLKDVRPAQWPQAEFIVGNPPFQGGKDFRDVFGSPYAEALWKTYPDMPQSSDFVMYWWDRAASAARTGKTRRFGLITTNSITQVFNRQVTARHLDAKTPISLLFAIPDHPWVGERGAAAVRVAMTVGAAGTGEGELRKVVMEGQERTGRAELSFATATGKIASDLTIGADLTKAKPLLANDFICSPGVKLHGEGFIVTRDQAAWLGLGTDPGVDQWIKPYRNARDLSARPRDVMVIDVFGLTELELRDGWPKIWQWLHERVKPQRDGQASDSPTADARQYAKLWWLFGKPRPELRPALGGLGRFIVTGETGKHRPFLFMNADMRPDNKIIVVASDDAFHLGILSSRMRVTWALAAGGKLEDRPVYVKTSCFGPFPFPSVTDPAAIRDLGERLDAHRKARQAEDPTLTLTGMYNVLARLRAGTPLDAKELQIHEQGLVSVLKQIHDDLDAAVAAAYGWRADLSDQEVLQRLVALNAERRAEEQAGTVRWLRPDYQPAKAGIAKPVQPTLDVGQPIVLAAARAFPKSLPDQMGLVRAALTDAPAPLLPKTLAKTFKGAKTARVAELLRTLVAMGQARAVGDRFSR